MTQTQLASVKLDDKKLDLAAETFSFSLFTDFDK